MNSNQNTDDVAKIENIKKEEEKKEQKKIMIMKMI